MRWKYSHLAKSHWGTVQGPGLAERWSRPGGETSEQQLPHRKSRLGWMASAKDSHACMKLPFTCYLCGESVGVGVQGWRPELLSTIYPSISVPEQSWQAWVVLTVLWALHRPCHSGLCSQGHWRWAKVGKGEHNSQEMVIGNDSWEEKGGQRESICRRGKNSNGESLSSPSLPQETLWGG